MSYYAFSSAWPGTIVSFVLMSCFAWADTFYVDAWQIFFVSILLFRESFFIFDEPALTLAEGLNNLAMCVLRYRLHMENAGQMAIQQLFKWRKSSHHYRVSSC